jgi:nicotinamidase-related amidase
MNVIEADGFCEWLENRMKEGVKILVVGGCTTTSCVRVSTTEIMSLYGKKGLQVIIFCIKVCVW